MKDTCRFQTGLRLAVLFLFASTVGIAQNDPLSDADDSDQFNLYTGVSAVILPKEGVEINLLNSLNSFWIALQEYDAQADATRIVDRQRYSRADHSLRVSYGFSSTNRWDLGASLHYARVRQDAAARSSPFRVFNDSNPADGTTYSGISGVGLQVRAMPFAGLPELTLQGGAVFPVAKNDELKAYLNAQRTQVFLTGTFYQRLGPATLAFLQADWRLFLQNANNERSLMAPAASGYLVFELPNDRWYIFPGIAYGITFQKLTDSNYRLANQQLYGSLGILYRPGPAFNILLTGQLPFIFESGSSRTVWVRESYTGLNLGFRYIL